MPNDNLQQIISQPEKWFQNKEELTGPILENNEMPTMMMHFQITKEDEIIHILFMTIKKEEQNKIITRNAIIHEKQNTFCEQHKWNIAEYDLQDKEELCKETKKLGLLSLIRIQQDTKQIAQNGTTWVMYTPEDATKEQLLEALKQNPEIPGMKEIIDLLFNNQQENKSLFNIELPKEEHKLEKAAKEQELIEKFGKKKMETLAKKIKYRGELLNKRQ